MLLTVSSIVIAALKYNTSSLSLITGYSQEEKIEIAHRHLIAKQLAQHGLTPEQIQIPPETTLEIITRYTREAGVRSLDRSFGAVCRAVAVKVAEGQHRDGKPESADVTDVEDRKANPSEEPRPRDISGPADLSLPPEMPILIDHHALKDILGAPLYETEVGGGCVCHYVHRSSGSFDLLDSTDIHLHFPAGAVTKDGPSAGVAIVTCLASLFSGRLVCSDIAMTGEITLRGLVLPVGGIKDKVLAAHRAKLKRVIIPQRNEKDLEEIPLNVRRDLTFILAGSLEDVLNTAFDGGFLCKRGQELLNSKL
ncbi:hypothetical protein GDO78_003345 [Eleutherodactylus coqui]|uniref:Lon proteolytic domain-containing protein n=1 Tax=Eleutherodactylus coqui TaxID=57060 RepID=A0A8J6K0Z8_ELECQ|nr:hypothetical protein GDO78_003345 [Eleutherodactylus coqui]